MYALKMEEDTFNGKIHKLNFENLQYSLNHIPKASRDIMWPEVDLVLTTDASEL